MKSLLPSLCSAFLTLSLFTTYAQSHESLIASTESDSPTRIELRGLQPAISLDGEEVLGRRVDRQKLIAANGPVLRFPVYNGSTGRIDEFSGSPINVNSFEVRVTLEVEMYVRKSGLATGEPILAKMKKPVVRRLRSDGPTFSAEMKALFAVLSPGDVIEIAHVKAKDAQGSRLQVPSSRFKLK